MEVPSKGEGMHCLIHNLAREIPEAYLEIVKFPLLHTGTTFTGSRQRCLLFILYSAQNIAMNIDP
jgi:hypothetical protein